MADSATQPIDTLSELRGPFNRGVNEQSSVRHSSYDGPTPHVYRVPNKGSLCCPKAGCNWGKVQPKSIAPSHRQLCSFNRGHFDPTHMASVAGC